jgi:radical SAM protein with 4Fe4S-binding SPASM domain
MTRAKGAMPMDLFRKIIDEAALIPLIDKVTIAGLGEPLLDKTLIEKLKYIRKKMKIGCLDIYTNGSLLTVDIVKEMMKIPVSMIYVSLNAVNTDQRHELMGLYDYDHVESVLHEAIKITKDTSTKIIVKAVTGKDLIEPDDNNVFMEKWGGSYNGADGNAFMHLEGNWAGKTFPMRIKPKNVCARAFEQIMVLWDGRVSLCCFDSDGEVILGDLKTQSLKEIYAGGEALRYRQAHAGNNRSTLKLCKDCTTI